MMQGPPLPESIPLQMGTPGNQLVPLPHQINPAIWDSMSPVAQQLTYSALKAGKAQGGAWDPNEWLRQMNAARPKGYANRQTTTQYQSPASMSVWLASHGTSSPPTVFMYK